MLLLIALSLLILSGVVYYSAMRLIQAIDHQTAELLKLRVHFSARQSTARMMTGADQDGVEELRKVSRRTRGKSIVFGGDEDSEQHRNLTRQSKVGGVI